MEKATLQFVLVFSLLFVSLTFAQVKISGGLFGGVNYAGITVDPVPAGQSNSKYLIGFQFGGVLNFGFAGGYSIRTEPMYLQIGAKTTRANTEIKTKESYFSLPVMFTYAFETGSNKFQPYIMAGPVMGILLSAKYVFSNGNETDAKDLLKSVDFSATFGAGVNIAAGSNTVFIEGRYSLGFSNINNNPASPNTTIKTKGYGLNAGITFPFGN